METLDLLTAFAAFAFVSSITPGPNNLMLMTSGANFGFQRTLPHMLGVVLGFGLMIVLVGLGLMQVFDSFPISYTVLKVVSVLYLGWLAWKIAHASAPDGKADAHSRPMTFLQAAAFQWVNPKAWAMGLTAVSAYVPDHSTTGVLWVALIFTAINLPCINCWTVLGLQIRRILTNPSRLRLFNWTMAALLIASLWPVVFSAS